jgi:ABC-type polysaccharide/polyol phosphate export permease
MITDFKTELREVYRFRYVVYSYIETTLRLRYRRSTLGFVWTVLAPMLNYLVIGIVFSFIMKGTIPNYFTYYFAGAIFFSIISSSLNRAPTFFIGNEHFIRKIYLPKLIFVLNGTIYEIVNFTISAFALIILGLIAGKLHLSWHAVLIIIPLFLVSFFLLGLGCIIAIASVYFRDLLNIVPIIVQALFFLTPVIYDKSVIPAKYDFILTLNPFYYFLEIYRLPLVFQQFPPIHYYAVCFVCSLVSVVVGIIMIKSFDNKIVFKL